MRLCGFYYGAFHVESCLALCSRGFFFFSPLSIVITSLGEERACMCASRAFMFDYFAHINGCPNVRPWLRIVTVALPGHFLLTF